MMNTKNSKNSHTKMIHHYLPLFESLSDAYGKVSNDLKWQEFWRTVRLMRSLLPADDDKYIRVRITDEVPDDRLADTSKTELYYLIRLNKEKVTNSPELAFTLLAHEWAHVLTWGTSHPHGDEWGIQMARCWRLISGEVLGGLQ